VIVGQEEGVFTEAEHVGGAAVDLCAVEEAGDEVFNSAARGFPGRPARKESASAGSFDESKYSSPSGEL
jgi:hypothetical protein